VKIEFSEIGMIEIEEFFKLIISDIIEYTEKEYILDFDNVEVLSLAAIQILISLKKYCDEKHIEFNCININSNSILQSLEIYNLKETLGIKK